MTAALRTPLVISPSSAARIPTVVLTALAALCGCGAPVAPGKPITATAPVVAATPVTATPPVTTAKGGYEQLLCAGRSPCTIADVIDAGVDADAHVLTVVMVRLPDAGDEVAMPGCAPAEHWLVVGNAAQPIRRQLLASGMSGDCGSIGNSAMTSAGNFDFGEHSGGGHPEHFDHSNTVTLSPLGLFSERGQDAERFPGTNVVSYDWSWSTFSGNGSAQYFRCDASGKARNEPGPTIHWVTLPTIPAGAAAGATHLAGCAAYVDGNQAGFTLRGRPSTAADASFRAAVVGNELLVEVTDDHWVGPGKDWTRDDHVEIWLAMTASPQRLSDCEDLDANDALQWGVRIADGAVVPGHGHPTDKLAVRRSPARAEDGKPVLLAIALPRWFDKTSGITVTYSDSDDGKTQKRLVSTSELRSGKPWTIGRARVIAPRDATCAVSGGRLEPLLNHAFDPDQAVIRRDND